jgi:hypothetical protein
MDVIRVRLRKKVFRYPLFTIKKKVNVNSKYGVVRFITKMIKRNDESPVSKVETKPFRHAEQVVKFIQIFRTLTSD